MTTTDVPNHHADHPGFSGLAGLLAGLTMVPRRGGVARLAAQRCAVGPGDHVVDVGSGPGTAAREAARRGARVTGVDPAPVMLRLARLLSRFRRGPGPGAVGWTEGRAEALPVADGSATVLWSIATVHHWPDLDAGLGEARRALAPGGRLLVIERRAVPGATGLASHGWTDPQAARFADLCRAAGFTGVEVAECSPGRRTLLVVQGTRP
jgi:ubiquinone/menaquinone biosynthesis C-methylase UbiE